MQYCYYLSVLAAYATHTDEHQLREEVKLLVKQEPVITHVVHDGIVHGYLRFSCIDSPEEANIIVQQLSTMPQLSISQAHPITQESFQYMAPHLWAGQHPAVVVSAEQ